MIIRRGQRNINPQKRSFLLALLFPGCLCIGLFLFSETNFVRQYIFPTLEFILHFTQLLNLMEIDSKYKSHNNLYLKMKKEKIVVGYTYMGHLDKNKTKSLYYPNSFFIFNNLQFVKKKTFSIKQTFNLVWVSAAKLSRKLRKYTSFNKFMFWTTIYKGKVIQYSGDQHWIFMQSFSQTVL